MSTKPEMKTDNYQAAQAKANKAEAKRLAALLKKMDGDLGKLLRSQKSELRKLDKARSAKAKQFHAEFVRAERSTDRAKKQIYRRLQILNGRAN